MKISFEVMMDMDGKKVPVFKLDRYLYAFVLGYEDDPVFCRDSWAGSINYFDPIATTISPEEEEKALEVLSRPESLEVIKKFMADQENEESASYLSKERIKLLKEEHLKNQKIMLEGLKKEGR